jgi:hypothetical protein
MLEKCATSALMQIKRPSYPSVIHHAFGRVVFFENRAAKGAAHLRAARRGQRFAAEPERRRACRTRSMKRRSVRAAIPPWPAVEADQTSHAADIQPQYVSGACNSQPDSALATIDIIE